MPRAAAAAVRAHVDGSAAPTSVFISPTTGDWGDLAATAGTLRARRTSTGAAERALFHAFTLLRSVPPQPSRRLMTRRVPAREQMHGNCRPEINQARGMPNCWTRARRPTRAAQEAATWCHFGKCTWATDRCAEAERLPHDESFVNAGEGPQLEFAASAGAGLRSRSSEFSVNSDALH